MSDQYESGWYINWYLDCTYSGSCKDLTQKWLIDGMDCGLKEFDEKWKRIKEGSRGDVSIKDQNYSQCYLHYLDRDAYLILDIYMSCSGL